MDRYGGPAAPPRPPKLLPRVHRPRAPAPIMSTQSSPPPVTAPLTPLTLASRRRPPPLPTLSSQISSSSQATPVLESPVSLTAPRPDGDRAINEYVDAPFRPVHQVRSSSAPRLASIESSSAVAVSQVSVQSASSALSSKVLPRTSTAVRPNALPTRPVTKQPVSFSKKPPAHHALAGEQGESSGVAECLSRGSIICPECGRCRCEGCQKPRPLPSRWVCDNTCFCSAETIIDYASCLCCVKALFYHCAKDHDQDAEEGFCADNPCSCLPHRWAARWGCMGALSVVLPCLWCYWPLRGCEALCAGAYARHSRHGCRCPQTRAPKTQARNSRPTELTPEKRLLDSSPEY